MILWTAIFVMVGGVTAAIGGALAIAADQTRQEEERARDGAELTRSAA
jgi:hypothetical protein